jgi:DNA-binding phage protein
LRFCTAQSPVAYLSGVFAGALKEVTAMKSMLASIAVAITFFAAPAVSAEFPKTGEAEYDTYYIDNVLQKIDSEAGMAGIVEETGITSQC